MVEKMRKTGGTEKPAGGGGKTKKHRNTNKAAVQYGRTAKNTIRRRDRHASQHPKDAEARRNWASSPVKYNK